MRRAQEPFSIGYVDRSVFSNDSAPPEIYPLSLHDALPICALVVERGVEETIATEGADALEHVDGVTGGVGERAGDGEGGDRKSTRLNSSHVAISYAVFCLKKKRQAALAKAALALHAQEGAG